MRITSKFRTAYIIKCFLGYIVALVCIGYCLSFYRNIYNFETSRNATIILILILIFTITSTFDLLKITKLIVTKQNLEIYSFFQSKPKIIEFSEIKKVERRRIVHQGRAGQIGDGYHVSDVFFKKGKRITISPDKFENYLELIQKIKNNLN